MVTATRPPAEALGLSVAVAFLAAGSSAVGLIRRDVYRDEELFVRAGWFGNDLVTLFVMVPVLLGATWAARSGAMVGVLVWLGALQSFVYNYAFYLFGAAPNRLLASYVLIVSLALTALVVGLVSLDPRSIRKVGAGTRRFLVAYLALWAVLLGLLWLLQLGMAAARDEPARLNGSVHAFRVTAALDLTLVVPFVIVALVLVARRHPWGAPAAVILNVKGVLYPLVLIASSWTADRAGVEGAAALIPLWVAFLAASTIALALLLRPHQETG